MKLIFLVIALAVAVTSGQRFNELSENAKKIVGPKIEKCKKDNNIDEAAFRAIKEGKYLGGPSSCFYKCVLKDTGIIDENNNIIESMVMKFDGHLKGRAKAVYQECEEAAARNKDNLCQNAYNIYECFRKEKGGFL